MDTQVSGYILAAQSMFPDEYIAGCIYDVLRKPDVRPKKATPPEKRRYRKRDAVQIAAGMVEDAAELLYKNQRLHDETYVEFGNRVAEKIMTSDKVQFRRTRVARTQSDLFDHMQDIKEIAQLIQYCETQGHSPRNPDACHKWGRPCEFYEHCANGEDIATSGRFAKSEYVKNLKSASHSFWHLPKPTRESTSTSGERRTVTTSISTCARMLWGSSTIM